MTTGWGAYASERGDMARMASGMTAAAAKGDREWADDLWKTLDAPPAPAQGPPAPGHLGSRGSRTGGGEAP